MSRVISVLIAAALIFTFSMSNESLAGLKIGAFNFLRRDKNGEKIIIVPEKSEPIIYKSYDELPSYLKNVLWDPGVSAEEYLLEQISVDKDSGDIIVTYSDVINEEGYFKIYYTDKILDDLKDMDVDYIVFYNGVKIVYYVDNDNTYRASFNISDQFYCIESNNADKVYGKAYDLVDFVLDENKLVN